MSLSQPLHPRSLVPAQCNFTESDHSVTYMFTSTYKFSAHNVLFTVSAYITSDELSQTCEKTKSDIMSMKSVYSGNQLAQTNLTG